jgi:hypothetical protein
MITATGGSAPTAIGRRSGTRRDHALTIVTKAYTIESTFAAANGHASHGNLSFSEVSIHDRYNDIVAKSNIPAARTRNLPRSGGYKSPNARAAAAIVPDGAGVGTGEDGAAMEASNGINYTSAGNRQRITAAATRRPMA